MDSSEDLVATLEGEQVKWNVSTQGVFDKLSRNGGGLRAYIVIEVM